MTANAPTSYDEVPYTSYPFLEAHPDRLATLATLFGLTPVDVTRCCVLELGCASGGNLLPLAEVFPGSRFVGVDLSKRQVEAGQGFVQKLGFTNIELRHASIMDVDSKWGMFDYIVCHGVYSWVPTAVQEKILEVCKQNLNPDGVAYVSYNTLPGWHMRGMIRDMMRYHAMRFAEPATRIGQARALLDFLVQAVGNQPDNPYSSLLKMEAEMMKQSEDWYLYHEHLEEINVPIYFHEFVERARAHGLKFLGEAQIRQMVPGNYPAEVEQVLQRLSQDIIHMEQYMDFLRNRMFRHTLLCHPEKTPEYSLSPKCLRGLHVATVLKPANPLPDLATTASERFNMPVGPASVQITDPLLKHAVMVLIEAWPASVPFEEMCRAARSRLTPKLAADEATFQRDMETLGRMLLQFYTAAVDRLVEVRTQPLPVATKVPEKPRGGAVSRLQAAQSQRVVNLKHELGTLGDFERHLLQNLDGMRDKAALNDVIMVLVEKGVLNATINGQRVTDPVQVRQVMSQAIDEALGRFAQHAYLLA
jgi:methyltransferase-like protein/SAM-dependent methyltransferase